MCDVEIVTHCWKYSRALAYQISGLVLEPPKCNVQLTVFYNEEDEDTKHTIKTLDSQLPSNVYLVPLQLRKPELFRRAIGRNIACLGTLAKGCLILTDADYIWPGRAVDEVLELGISPETAITFPESYWKQLTHAIGDEYLARQATPQVLPLDPRDFEESSIDKAIGGIQVYRADVARQFGYLNGTKWMEPHRGDKFACCRCDKAWRGWLKEKGHEPKAYAGGGKPYRIRHTRNGRVFADINN